MNREQKRNFIKLAKKRGIGEEYAKAYISMKEQEDGDKTLSTKDILFNKKEIKDGDKVQINVDKIMSSKNYQRMVPEYREFVESSNGVYYTANVEKGNLISFEENPKWLFWAGDLII
mgnify:CR=1 FL=1